jgi:hypothetical protein
MMATLAHCGCTLGLIAKKFLFLSTGREVLVCEACFSVGDPTFGLQEPLAGQCAVQVWSLHDDMVLMNRYAAGQSTAQIAHYFKVGRHTIEARFRELGLPFLKKDGGRCGLYTSGQLVDLFGGHIGAMRIYNWMGKEYFGPTLPRQRRKRSPRFITHDALIAFLENPAHWCGWEVEWITDPQVQEYAAIVRSAVAWRWLDLKAAGAIVCFHPRTVMAWIEKGVLPGHRHDNHWYVRSDHIATIQRHIELLPDSGSQRRRNRNRDLLISQLRAIVEEEAA